MQYFKLPGNVYFRGDLESEFGQEFDDDDGEWVESGRYYMEVYYNGGGVPITEAEALAAVGVI